MIFEGLVKAKTWLSRQTVFKWKTNFKEIANKSKKNFRTNRRIRKYLVNLPIKNWKKSLSVKNFIKVHIYYRSLKDTFILIHLDEHNYDSDENHGLATFSKFFPSFLYDLLCIHIAWEYQFFLARNHFLKKKKKQ